MLIDGPFDLNIGVEGDRSITDAVFEGIEPSRQRFCCSFLQRVAVELNTITDIATNTISDLAAQKFEHRQSSRFALELPQRHVETTHGAGMHNTPSPPEIPITNLPQPFHIGGVLADKSPLQFHFDLCLHGHLVELGRRFANADESLIRFDFHEGPATWPTEIVLYRTHHVATDIGDFHVGGLQ